MKKQKEMKTKQKKKKQKHKKGEKKVQWGTSRENSNIWFLTKKLGNSELNFWNLLGFLTIWKYLTRLRHPRQLSNVLFPWNVDAYHANLNLSKCVWCCLQTPPQKLNSSRMRGVSQSGSQTDISVIYDASDVAPYRQSDTSPVLERLWLGNYRKRPTKRNSSLSLFPHAHNKSQETNLPTGHHTFEKR